MSSEIKKDYDTDKYTKNIKHLNDEGVPYVIENASTGHMIIAKVVDFYAATGTWMHRGTPFRGRGIPNMINYMRARELI